MYHVLKEVCIVLMSVLITLKCLKQEKSMGVSVSSGDLFSTDIPYYNDTQVTVLGSIDSANC